MGLREDLLRGIYAYGFEKPSAIQQRAIKPVIKGTFINQVMQLKLRNWVTALSKGQVKCQLLNKRKAGKVVILV